MFFIPAEHLENYQAAVSLLKMSRGNVELYVDPDIWQALCCRAAFWRFYPFTSFADIDISKSGLDNSGFPVGLPAFSEQELIEQVCHEVMNGVDFAVAQRNITF